MTDPPPSVALFTDLYELTMAQAYWQNRQTGTAVFSLLFREYPPDRCYFVFAGLEDVLSYLENFRFSSSDIAYLRRTGRFAPDFLSFLSELRFTGSVRAMDEGTLLFADEPCVEVTGPVIEAQLVETYIINQVNLQTILATKASRAVHAAGGKTVVDFGARRTQGIDAADKMARVGYMTGFQGTSNVAAGLAYGIPTVGTMAHSFITTFEDETESFRAYARSFPDDCVFLVDTYDTFGGIECAIRVGLEMRAEGHWLRAVRLDSGDLTELAHRARSMLDGAGLEDVEVFASGGLDEFSLDETLSEGAPVDGFGVGTKVVVSADAPWSDCAYKLVAYEGRPVLKLSSGKETLPGPKQVYRFTRADGLMDRDLLDTADGDGPAGGQPLIHDVMRGGRRVEPPRSLGLLRERFLKGFDRLPEKYKALRSPPGYPVETSPELEALRLETVRSIRERTARPGTRSDPG